MCQAIALIAAVNHYLSSENKRVRVCVLKYLEVSVYNSHLVQVVYSIQDLSDQRTRILLCVETFFHDSVK